MLKLLGCQRVLLLTNNPAKLAGLAETGIERLGNGPQGPEQQRDL
jgi:GTP cyclohydrolase II